jgi:hypothetical protein
LAWEMDRGCDRRAKTRFLCSKYNSHAPDR